LGAAELRSAAAAKFSLADAIAFAEKNSPGGIVLEASYQHPKGSPAAYSLRSFGNAAVWAAKVDINSGQVLGASKTTPENELDAEDKAELSALQSATTNITQAIQRAEQHAKGKAISAELEKTRNGAAWEIVVANQGKARKVVIDPKTGQVRTKA
jgi:Peptidase propeptide and YPEB domain